MENNEEILKKISSGDPEAIAEAVDTVKENGDLVIAGKLLDILSQPRTVDNHYHRQFAGRY